MSASSWRGNSRSTAFGHEHVARWRGPRASRRAACASLPRRSAARTPMPFFDASHVHHALREIDLIPRERAKLGNTQVHGRTLPGSSLHRAECTDAPFFWRRRVRRSNGTVKTNFANERQHERFGSKPQILRRLRGVAMKDGTGDPAYAEARALRSSAPIALPPRRRKASFIHSTTGIG